MNDFRFENRELNLRFLQLVFRSVIDEKPETIGAHKAAGFPTIYDFIHYDADPQSLVLSLTQLILQNFAQNVEFLD